MINHFRTYLLNRSPAFFLNSLFPVFMEESFQPSYKEEYAEEIDKALFGENPDASLLDYRFFQILRIIDGCLLSDHLLRFDPRETYVVKERNFNDEHLFQSRIYPEKGLSLSVDPSCRPSFLRNEFSVLKENEGALVVLKDGKNLNQRRISSDVTLLENLGVYLTVRETGYWRIDYRYKPLETVEEVIERVLNLPRKVFLQLFASIKEQRPEYENAFRVVTDSLTKFCMVLFALAASNELTQSKQVIGQKMISENSIPSASNTAGTFYYGSHASASLRLIDIKKDMNALSDVKERTQKLALAVPAMAYLYLCWPVRFGIPPRQRIVLDGFLNSAWVVRYLDDLDEQYVCFRSEYKIQSSEPIAVEIP